MPFPHRTRNSFVPIDGEEDIASVATVTPTGSNISESRCITAFDSGGGLGGACCATRLPGPIIARNITAIPIVLTLVFATGVRINA